jgi:hypothetical protein
MLSAFRSSTRAVRSGSASKEFRSRTKATWTASPIGQRDRLAMAPCNGGPVAFLCLPKCHLLRVSQLEIQKWESLRRADGCRVIKSPPIQHGKGALERAHHAFAQCREESVMASTFNSIVSPRPLIELIDNEGEWFVRVVENGRETVNTFDMESFANVYAEEQRLKLDVKFVRRV